MKNKYLGIVGGILILIVFILVSYFLQTSFRNFHILIWQDIYL